MKKIIRVLAVNTAILLFVLPLFSCPLWAEAKVACEYYSEDILTGLPVSKAAAPVGAKLDIKAKSVVLMEPHTGQILYENNKDERLAPASVTKIMSLLLIMEAIENEKISLETTVSASEHAASMGGSQIWLKEGERLTVDEMLKAVCVVSANDCAVALAEHLAGSEEAFVARMNQRAGELGMEDTTLLTPKGGLTAKAQACVAFGLAMFPTVFNACNLMVMIWFTKLYVKIVCWLIPTRHKDTEEEFTLKYIGRGLLSASELNITQAQKEIAVYGERVHRMLGMARDLIHTSPKDDHYGEVFNRLEKYEEISDRMEIEIGNFLNKVAEGRLSPEGKMRVAGMLRIISEIESIADSCYNVAKTMNRKNANHVEFTPAIMKEIDQMFAMVEEAMDNMLGLLREMETPEDARIIKAYNKEREINNLRNTLRDGNIFNINNHAYGYQEGIFFMDLIGEAEKLGDYMLNVVEGVKH